MKLVGSPKSVVLDIDTDYLLNVHPPDLPPRRACGCRGGAATMLLTAAGSATAWSAPPGFRWWCAYAPRIRFRRAFSLDRPDVIQFDMVCAIPAMIEKLNTETDAVAAALFCCGRSRPSSSSAAAVGFVSKLDGMRACPP
jgi:hypothetical protein